MTSELLPEVSIIVTAYNNADTIGESLSTLYSQTYLEKKIVVVCDTSSSDRTLRVIEDFVKSRSASRHRSASLGSWGIRRLIAITEPWKTEQFHRILFVW